MIKNIIVTLSGATPDPARQKEQQHTRNYIKLPLLEGMVELRAVSTPYGPSLEYRVTHQQQRATKQDKPGRKLYQQFAQSSSMSGMLSVGANVTLEKAVIMTQDGNLVISIPKA